MDPEDFSDFCASCEADAECKACIPDPFTQALFQGCCVDGPGHGERSRSQLHVNLAGTGTRLILGWLFKFVC